MSRRNCVSGPIAIRRRMRTACGLPGKPAAGLSLVELLVAILVMGIGVLGVCGLQLLSLQNSRAALHSAEAAQLANDMMERIRANSGDGPWLTLYDGVALGDPPPMPADCAALNCTRAQMAEFDKAVWKCSLGAFRHNPVCTDAPVSGAWLGLAPGVSPAGLPGGDGAVVADAGNGRVRVTVRWRGRQQHRFVSIESRG